MDEGVIEGSFPDSADNLEEHQKKTLVKQATLWFRIDGLLDRMLTALKHLAALTTQMQTRRHEPVAPEYPQGIGIHYHGESPEPTREPSWQGYLAKIVAVLIASGVGSLIWILSSMNSRLTAIEANQVSSAALMIQKLDAQERHLEAHDKQLDEINREIWPHKH